MNGHSSTYGFIFIFIYKEDAQIHINWYRNDPGQTALYLCAWSRAHYPTRDFFTSFSFYKVIRRTHIDHTCVRCVYYTVCAWFHMQSIAARGDVNIVKC